MTYSFIERKRRKERKKNIVTLAVFLFLLSSAFFFGYKFLNKPFFKQPAALSLQKTVENSLAGTTGTYAAAIKNLKNGEIYSLNENRIFDAGSLYKLWIMAETFKQVEEGKSKEDDPLTADIAALNAEFNIAPEEAEMTEGILDFTIGSALNQMITISHNYAALALTQKIGLSKVAGFLKENGFTGSVIGENGNPPKTTAKDIMNFYERLYKKELANEDNTQKMIELLKKQQLNDGLPKYLPEESKGAHKTGDIGFFKHDAGIVLTPYGDYIIVVLSESESPLGAQERIAALSKAVYDYFLCCGTKQSLAP